VEDKYKAKLAKEKQDDSDDSSDYSDSESDEEEDESGELLTPAVDAQILKTLSDIRSGSAKIYDSSVNFFDAQQLEAIQKEWRAKHGESNKAKLAKNEKPVTLKDYHRELLLSGKWKEDREEDQEEPVLSHVQEQEMLRKEIKAAFKASSSASEEEEEEEGEGNLFKKRARSAEEVAREEEDYRNFLLENLATAENAKESMSDWLNYRAGFDTTGNTGTAQSKDDAFLIDYVLNKGWMDKAQSRLPSYDQIVAEASASEEELERADEYEAALNFRFEQEGGAQVQTFSRTIEGSLRRPETKRKDARAVAKERKSEEKVRKAEELKRLKNLKFAEIRAKLEKIQKVAETPELPEDDLMDELAGGDFDAVKHDALMAKIAQKVNDYDGDEKPEFSDISDCESEKSIDSVADDDDEVEMKIKTKSVKKARKAFKSILKQTQGETGMSAALEELYQLDYEDLIGDIPCRFKYQRVEPSTFGLKIDDILEADDAELNRYFALKKLAPYRAAEVMERDIEKYATSKRLRDLRQNVKQKKKKNNNNKKKPSKN
jgi:protein KRI1